MKDNTKRLIKLIRSHPEVPPGFATNKQVDRFVQKAGAWVQKASALLEQIEAAEPPELGQESNG